MGNNYLQTVALAMMSIMYQSISLGIIKRTSEHRHLQVVHLGKGDHERPLVGVIVDLEQCSSSYDL